MFYKDNSLSSQWKCFEGSCIIGIELFNDEPPSDLFPNAIPPLPLDATLLCDMPSVVSVIESALPHTYWRDFIDGPQFDEFFGVIPQEIPEIISEQDEEILLEQSENQEDLLMNISEEEPSTFSRENSNDDEHDRALTQPFEWGY